MKNTFQVRKSDLKLGNREFQRGEIFEVDSFERVEADEERAGYNIVFDGQPYRVSYGDFWLFYIKEVYPVKNLTPKFKVGDKCNFVNDYGIFFAGYTISAVVEIEGAIRYYTFPSDSYWYPSYEKDICQNKEEARQMILERIPHNRDTSKKDALMLLEMTWKEIE